MLSDPLAVIGVFMMGASVGAIIMHVRYKSLLHDCRKALEFNVSASQQPTMSQPYLMAMSVTGGKQAITQRPASSLHASVKVGRQQRCRPSGLDGSRPQTPPFGALSG